MAYDDDNERIERMMFGVPYKATTAEARRVFAEVVESPAWLLFNVCDDLMKSPGASLMGKDDIPSGVHGLGATARESAAAYRQCVRNAIKAIEAMEAERS